MVKTKKVYSCYLFDGLFVTCNVKNKRSTKRGHPHIQIYKILAEDYRAVDINGGTIVFRLYLRQANGGTA